MKTLYVEKDRLMELRDRQREDFSNHRDYERELRTVSANIDMILGKNREKEQELEKKFFPNSFACKRLRERSQNLQTLQKHYTKANGIRILLQY